MLECIDMEETRALVIGGIRIRISELLLADDLAVASPATSGLQKEIDLVHIYCNGWNLRCNLDKSKVVFKKGENKR